MPRFSVIVPVSTKTEFTEHSFDCLLSQSFVDFELLLSCSPEALSSKEISKIKELDSRVKIIAAEGDSVPEARHAGIDGAAGEYVLFFTPGDSWYKNLLEKLDSYVTACGADIIMFGNRQNGVSAAFNPEHTFRDGEFFIADSQERLFDCFVDSSQLNPLGNKAYKRELFDDAEIEFEQHKFPFTDELLLNLPLFFSAKSVAFYSQALCSFQEQENAGVYTAEYFSEYTMSRERVWDYIKLVGADTHDRLCRLYRDYVDRITEFIGGVCDSALSYAQKCAIFDVIAHNSFFCEAEVFTDPEQLEPDKARLLKNFLSGNYFVLIGRRKLVSFVKKGEKNT